MSAYFAFFGYLSYKLTGAGDAEGLVGVPVTARFFEVLGVEPARGRLFSAEELQPNGPKAALLTHDLFQGRFAGDPAVVGRNITLNGEPVRVVGVMPADFDFGSVFTPGVHVDLFVPVHPSAFQNSGNVFSVVGRLKPGVSIDAARAELDGLLPRLLRQYQDWGRVTARVVLLVVAIVAGYVPALRASRIDPISALRAE